MVTSILAWPLISVMAESTVAIPESNGVLSSFHFAVSIVLPAKSSVSKTCGTATTSTFNGAETQFCGLLEITKVVAPRPTGVIVTVRVSGAPAGKFRVRAPFTAPVGTAMLGFWLVIVTEAGAAS